MSVRVLIVDDHDHVREMLAEVLKLQGFDVVAVAANAEEAMERAVETGPDVIIMDHRMPGTTGLEASRRIREQRPDQAVIIYSAYVDENLEREAADAGVVVCVPKASGVEALAREIAAVALGLPKGPEAT